MAKKRKPQPVNPYVQQAEQYAVIRYGPQVSGLRTLLDQARKSYQETVKNARAGSQAVQQSVAAAQPVIGQAYTDAGAQMANAAAIVNADLGQGGPSSALTQAIGLEREGSANRLAREQAFSQAALQQRATDAVVASRAAITGAKEQRANTVGQILSQANDVAAQRGAFVTSTAQDLAGDAASAQAKADAQAADRAQKLLIAKLNNRQDTQASIRSSGIDPKTGLPTQNAKTAAAKAEADAIKAGNAADDKYLTKFGMTRDEFLALPDDARTKLAQSASSDGSTTEKTPAGVKLATPAQFGSFQDSVSSAVSYAKEFKAHGDKRSTAAQQLVQGKSSISITDPKTGAKVKTKGVPKTDQLAASIALDLAYDGAISRRNRQELWKRGFTLDRLGYPQPKKPPTSKQVTRTAIGGIQGLDALLRQLG